MPVMTRAQAADAAAWQQHETLGGLIAQLRQLERDVGTTLTGQWATVRFDDNGAILANLDSHAKTGHCRLQLYS